MTEVTYRGKENVDTHDLIISNWNEFVFNELRECGPMVLICSLDEELREVELGKQYPVCGFDGPSMVGLKLAESANLHFKISNASGKLIYSDYMGTVDRGLTKENDYEFKGYDPHIHWQASHQSGLRLKMLSALNKPIYFSNKLIEGPQIEAHEGTIEEMLMPEFGTRLDIIFNL